MSGKDAHFEDPVAAYDVLASEYRTFSARRETYLRSIERRIVTALPAERRSMLDIGAGDGIRSSRIAGEAGIHKLVLVEPSLGMSDLSRSADLWRVRAEDVNPSVIAERFDVITCLWNVLGHVPTHEKRLRVLSAASQLLTERGRFFIDVIHRYNVRSYGWIRTAGRAFFDLVAFSPANGDVTARWKVKEHAISTYGHVFSHREIAAMVRVAGLEIVHRVVVDYETGELHKSPFLGNLFYVLRRSSTMDSSRAPQTS